MLQAIRDHAQGWIAWLIVILISIPFALWGIQSYLGIGGEPLAAKVNGHEITQRDLDRRFQQFKSRLRRQLGANYRPEMFDDVKLKRDILRQMIREAVVLQASHDMGLRAGDEQVRQAILAEPAFQHDGHFDKAAYERALQLQGMTAPQFEQRIRLSMMSEQLQRVVSRSAFTTDRETADAIRLERQERRFAYVSLPLADFKDEAPVTDAQVQAWYQDHKARFAVPEQVRLRYLVLDDAAIAAHLEPSEEDLRTLYRSEAAKFTQEERRHVRHILVAVPADADAQTEAAAKARAEALRRRLEAGEDFAALAKEASDDKGSAAKGGDLGVIEKGIMDPAFERAAYALKEGEISAPVRSRFGYHLIQVTAIEPARREPFEKVRAQLLEEYRANAVEQRYYDLAERLANLTYENPDSLVPAAEALGLKVRDSDWISRRGGPAPLDDPKVMAAAFSDDVLVDGHNSEVIEIERPGGKRIAVVVRVADHREASVKPLAEVRQEVVEAIHAERARRAAQAQAEAIREAVRKGTPLAQAAGKYQVTTVDFVAKGNAKAPPAVVKTAFSLPRPAAGGPTLGTARLRDGGEAVVALEAIRDGDPAGLSEEDKRRVRDRLTRIRARTYYDRLVDDLVARADVEILAKFAAEGK